MNEQFTELTNLLTEFAKKEKINFEHLKALLYIFLGACEYTYACDRAEELNKIKSEYRKRRQK